MFSKSFISKAKAFTLFTAMVSFIIIGIGVVVVQHIANSEQNQTQIISSLYRQQEMDAVKDLVRADVLQTFNVLFRAKVYDYYNNASAINDNPQYSACLDSEKTVDECNAELGIESNTNITYNPIDLKLPWSVFMDQQIKYLFFGKSNNLGDVFAIWVGDRILGQLGDYEGFFRGSQYLFRIYDYALQKSSPIDLKNINLPANLHGEILKQGMSEVFKGSYNSTDPSKNFIKILNCSNTNEQDCKNGSFYTNLYMTNMPYNNYLYLPRIFVYRTLDGSEMDDSILPRNVLSLYIPIRLFGALAFTRQELNSVPVDDYSNITWGYDLSSFNDCSFFNNKSISGDYFTKTDMINVLQKPENPSHQNDFSLNYDKMLANEYANKVINFTYPGGGTGSSIQYKAKTVDLYVSVNDNSKYYSFGNSGISIGFIGSRIINEYPNTTVFNCSCASVSPNQTFVDCSGISTNYTYDVYLQHNANLGQP